MFNLALNDIVAGSHIFRKSELRDSAPSVLVREYTCGYNQGARCKKRGDKEDYKRFAKLTTTKDHDAWDRGFMRGFREAKV